MIVRSPPTHPRDPIAKCPPLTSADANRTREFRRQHMICTNPICRPSRALVSELETRAHHTCTIHSHTRLRQCPRADRQSNNNGAQPVGGRAYSRARRLPSFGCVARLIIPMARVIRRCSPAQRAGSRTHLSDCLHRCCLLELAVRADDLLGARRAAKVALAVVAREPDDLRLCGRRHQHLWLLRALAGPALASRGATPAAAATTMRLPPAAASRGR